MVSNTQQFGFISPEKTKKLIEAYSANKRISDRTATDGFVHLMLA